MQHISHIILLCLCLSIYSCKENANELKDSSQNERLKYKRFSMDNVDSKGIIKSTVEIYVDINNDTIYNQFKKFDENGNIDKSKSEYFDFELRKDTLKNIYSGKVTYYNILDYKLKSPVIEKDLKLIFFQKLDDSTDIVEFTAKDQNFVEFEFYNKNDTLVGMLFEYRVLDTIINNEKMARIIETYHAVDNLILTDNPFIETFEINHEVVYE